MPFNISIEKATIADIQDITAIYLESRKKFVAFAPLIHSDHAVYQWIYDTLIPTKQVFVAKTNRAAVGMLAISVKNDVGWIEQLYISPRFVGCGIGGQLVTKAKEILHSPIHLHTFQENIKARHFYERHGFKALEFSDGSSNEERCPDVLYEWRE